MREAYGLLNGAFVTVKLPVEMDFARIAFNVTLTWLWGGRTLSYFKYRKFVRHEWSENDEEWDAVFQDHYEVIEYNFSLDEVEARYEADEDFYGRLLGAIGKLAAEKNGLAVITDDPALFRFIVSRLEDAEVTEVAEQW